MFKLKCKEYFDAAMNRINQYKENKVKTYAPLRTDELWC